MGMDGTDVAKVASDMILTNDNYATIVDAVHMGRTVFENIRKAIYFLLTCNFSEIILILGAKIMGWGMPLTPIMLLMINVIGDGIPGIALAREKADPEIMKGKPKERGISLFAGNRIPLFIQTMAFVVSGWTAYYIGKFVHMADGFTPSLIMGQTMAFIAIGWTSIWHIFTVRTQRSVFRTSFWANPILTVSAIAMTALFAFLVIVPEVGAIFGLIPISMNHWLAVTALSIIPTITADLYKLITMPRK
jgi:magnesium-transporting ATPase (P-type)